MLILIFVKLEVFLIIGAIILELYILNISNESEYLDPVLVAQKVVARLYPGITTEELDVESAEICVNLTTIHPSYSYLGGRILVSNLHKKTSKDFVSKMNQLSDETNNINSQFLEWVNVNSDILNSMVDYNRDYFYDYFGFKTLEKSYLMKDATMKIIERPQHLWMRVSLGLWATDLKKAFDLDPQLGSLLASKHFANEIQERQSKLRSLIGIAVSEGVPTMALSSALNYLDFMQQPRASTALIQGMRDFFGSHTYGRVDEGGIFHTLWSGNRSEVKQS